MITITIARPPLHHAVKQPRCSPCHPGILGRVLVQHVLPHKTTWHSLEHLPPASWSSLPLPCPQHFLLTMSWLGVPGHEPQLAPLTRQGAYHSSPDTIACPGANRDNLSSQLEPWKSLHPWFDEICIKQWMLMSSEYTSLGFLIFWGAVRWARVSIVVLGLNSTGVSSSSLQGLTAPSP